MTMTNDEYHKMETLAKTVLCVAENEKWDTADIVRQLAELALQAAQHSAQRTACMHPKSNNHWRKKLLRYLR
jgi:hypothetical protein